MNKISGVIIAKNDEKMIGGALDSLSFCDEVIVIDNGSKDKTRQQAIDKNAKVYEVDSNDFSQIRNEGLKKASYEWVLYVDSDERVDEELKKSIKKIVSQGSDYSAFKLLRKNFYFGNNEWPYIEKIERLFYKDKLKEWKGKIHESPVIEGKVGLLNGFLLHYTHRDLESMLNKTIEWSTTEALLRYNSNHPKMSWWRFPRVMVTAFFSSYIKQRGYRAGVIGLIESLYQAFSIFVTYAKLWELQNMNRGQRSGIKNQT